MAIDWVGWATGDPFTGARVLRVKLGDSTVLVYISKEALEDFGLEPCKDIAEGKILAAMRGEEPPDRVEVRASDFG